jgi:CRISPR-associated protein (TIGR02584 family)
MDKQTSRPPKKTATVRGAKRLGPVQMAPQVANASAIPERIILFAIVGTSPAVLTETIYVLASQSPPLVPHEIAVVTTTKGREKIVSQLLVPPKPGTNTPWNHFAMEMLKRGLDPDGRLAFGEASIRCIPAKNRSSFLDDVGSKEESALLADFLLSELRRFTEDPGTRVVASIAGGRKTMSALLLSCMTLLARPQDSVCHVLVSPPYEDSRLSPPFLFPETRLSHVLDGKKLPSSKARIDLIDVPFVKIRGWYLDRHGVPPPGYSQSVSYAQKFFSAPAPDSLPVLDFDMEYGVFSLDGVPIPLSPSHFLALCLFLLQKELPAKPGEIMWSLRTNDASDELDNVDWLREFRKAGRFTDRELAVSEDFRKVVSEVRAVLRKNPKTKPFAETLAPRLSTEKPTAVWPPDRISADIGFLFRFLPKG